MTRPAPDRGSAAPPTVTMEGMVKRFGTVTALDGAHLRLRSGEVHAVLGENGAGKTTLLGLLAGHLHADAGVVRIHGEVARFGTPRHAWARGVGMVHQHFTLVPRLSVLENLVLGTRTRAGGLVLPLADVRTRARRLMGRTGLEVALDAPVEELGVGRQQRAEILKVLLRDPEVLVLDEPTAVLTPSEVDGLLELIRTLAAEGRAVVLVAHKLDEVLAVADRITVLRDGRTVLTAPRAEVDGPSLARAMVGREVDDVTPERGKAGAGGAARHGGQATETGGQDRGPGTVPGGAEERKTVARLDGVELTTPGGASVLDGVGLRVGRGEIVGIAGVEGNGQRELALILAGRLTPDRGEVEVPDDPAFIPQDRRREGLVGAFDLVENVGLALHRRSGYRRGPVIRWGRIRERAHELMDRFDVRAPSARTRARELSGGNQQRLVVARELSGRPDLLVAENPTRGLDVAGEAFVHRQLVALREGAEGPPPGVVLISTDLDEVLRLADRILVMVRGRLLPVPEERRSREKVGAMMLSGGPVS